MGLFEALSAAVISRYLQTLVASRRALCISFHELSFEQRLIAIFTRSRLVTCQAHRLRVGLS